MKKKIIVLGCFLSVFLVVIIPIVNAVEYNQVENILKDKIVPNNIEVKVKNNFFNLKLADIQKLKYILSKIDNNPESSCSSCRINLSMRPFCEALLKLCLYFISLYLILSPSIMEADYFLIFSLTMFLTALGIGCVWALIIFVFPIRT